jgi:hypothetical protein
MNTSKKNLADFADPLRLLRLKIGGFLRDFCGFCGIQNTLAKNLWYLETPLVCNRSGRIALNSVLKKLREL